MHQESVDRFINTRKEENLPTIINNIKKSVEIKMLRGLSMYLYDCNNINISHVKSFLAALENSKGLALVANKIHVSMVDKSYDNKSDLEESLLAFRKKRFKKYVNSKDADVALKYSQLELYLNVSNSVVGNVFQSAGFDQIIDNHAVDKSFKEWVNTMPQGKANSINCCVCM